VTGYCYDAADRILATTGVGAVSSISYDTTATRRVISRWGDDDVGVGWFGPQHHRRVSGADPADITIPGMWLTGSCAGMPRRGCDWHGDLRYTGGGDSADVRLHQ